MIYIYLRKGSHYQNANIKNDVDELLKDQFIFGICNKEIQEHLLGEIKETDNSVRALYEARMTESKLAQRQML